MKKFVIGLIFLFILNKGISQNSFPKMEKFLSEDSTLFLKFTFLNQTWVRFNESNLGSTINGIPVHHTFDIGLRRTRMQFYGQLTDHVFFYTQFGMNNFNKLSQNAGNRKLQPFFHDVVTEYKVFKKNHALKIGGGLTILNGLSRFSQPSISTIATMDVPIFAQATVDQTDEFSRKLSIYIRGQWKKWDYRISLSDPFPINTNGQPAPVLWQFSEFSTGRPTLQQQAFLMYQIWDKEPHQTPYMTGTYLGKRKIWNIEGGIIYQKKAMMRLENIGTSQEKLVNDPILLWSLASFFEWPISSNGQMLHAYAGYFHTDYGKGYLRNNGIMNPANGVSIPGGSVNGAGNAFPMFGTGSVMYFELVYKAKDELLKKGGTLMPYITLQSAKYPTRIESRLAIFTAGISWLINEHQAKLSLDWQNRPVVFSSGFSPYPGMPGYREVVNRANQWVLQYQIAL